MCKSKAEGGQRCYSHANKEYMDAVQAFDVEEKELHSSRLYLQNVKNNIERLDIAYELGQVSDEDYNRHLDSMVSQREHAQESTLAHEKLLHERGEDISRTLNEVRTTTTGLAKLESEIKAETDPNKKHELQFAYNCGKRLRNVRQKAFERHLERVEKSKELQAKAQEKMRLARALPEYDEQTKRIKEQAVLDAELLSARAYLEMNNGREAFPALFDKNGDLVPAKITKTKHGRSWGILSDPRNPASRFTGFVTISQSKDPKKREEFYASKGYSVGKVWANADAKIVTDENNARRVNILRNDGGYSPYVETITTNQYSGK